MSLLKKLTTDDSIQNEKDSIGGGGVVDSGLYKCTINHAYVTVASSGAIGIVFSFKTEEGKDIRQTVYVTSGTAKGGSNTYTDGKGNKQYLPGFLLAESIALLTTGQSINALDTEDKVVPVYNAEAKQEIPTKVPMIMDLLGKEILLGVIRQKVDKTQKDAAGNYVPTGETREENDIEKAFRASDRKTTSEIRAEAEANFVNTWSEKWTGKVKDKTSKTGATAGAPKPAAGTTPKPTKSLFG